MRQEIISKRVLLDEDFYSEKVLLITRELQDLLENNSFLEDDNKSIVFLSENVLKYLIPGLFWKYHDFKTVFLWIFLCFLIRI